MSKTVKLFLALLLALGAVFGEQILSVIKENIEIVNTPSIDTSEPSLEYKTLVKDIVSVDIEEEDAKQISDFFSELSDIVQNDPGFIETTGNFREFNTKAGGLNFSGLKLKNKYPSLGEEIDEVLSNAIGLEDSSLTQKKRENLCECLMAIAWGVHQ